MFGGLVADHTAPTFNASSKEQIKDNTQTGILVTTSLTAGLDGSNLNHGEGIVVSTAITAGIDGGLLPGERQQHAEGLVRR